MDTWIWCLHCEQVAAHKAWDKLDGSCPTPGCDGHILGDGWSWDRVRQGREDRYPAMPEAGKVYPLYE